MTVCRDKEGTLLFLLILMVADAHIRGVIEGRNEPQWKHAVVWFTLHSKDEIGAAMSEHRQVLTLQQHVAEVLCAFLATLGGVAQTGSTSHLFLPYLRRGPKFNCRFY